MANDKKTCFIITPIGDDNSNIRRHIDGIIDQAISPALSDRYDITVSHREYEIGSITDRIIRNIYESDLVIANLTDKNPNVMFELAIRYSFGKPAIVIAEQGTKLPFDVNEENTAFYINDPAGAADLKNKICEFESRIDFSKTNYGPVQKVIGRIPLINDVESGKTVPINKQMEYIIDRLDSMEKMYNNIPKSRVQVPRYMVEVVFSSRENGTPLNQEFLDNIIRSCGVNSWAVYDSDPYEYKYRMELRGNQRVELMRKLESVSDENAIDYYYKVI